MIWPHCFYENKNKKGHLLKIIHVISKSEQLPIISNQSKNYQKILIFFSIFKNVLFYKDKTSFR